MKKGETEKKEINENWKFDHQNVKRGKRKIKILVFTKVEQKDQEKKS